MLAFGNINATATKIDFISKYIDPNTGHTGQTKSPVATPQVDVTDFIISFITPCDGCLLSIINADGEVEFTTVINSSTITLPSYLAGEYRIEIIRGNFCFWGYIEL